MVVVVKDTVSMVLQIIYSTCKASLYWWIFWQCFLSVPWRISFLEFTTHVLFDTTHPLAPFHNAHASQHQLQQLSSASSSIRRLEPCHLLDTGLAFIEATRSTRQTHSLIIDILGQQDNGLRWMMVLVDTRQQGESIYLGEQVDTVLFYTKGWQGMHIKGEGTSSRCYLFYVDGNGQ
ncbi:predicted protein [Lichtheimia corymbifera JMRC:FSU:9682]|uniref:Uncharacterized protein n=1 Tax=Lichtheimia corymbifera JMRC:FSU:9682 TaxID=1263082 RepID=A0A068SDU0_9FUNG|nr:predicted protein [Lichtheimia corymbifera JMRC:FSU:9682]